uniref:Uncharacterized protein n=1 Tax=Lygus hesperus TaxID=30085 RepID=A0A146LUS5_LYGHE
MRGSVQSGGYLLLFLVQWVADPAMTNPTVLDAEFSANHSGTTPEFFLDTDYRDYNISENHAEDVGELKTPSKPHGDQKYTTEQIICIRTSIKKGSTTLPIYITLKIRDNHTVLGENSLVAGKLNFSSFRCARIVTDRPAEKDDLEILGIFFFNVALGVFLLCLSLVFAVKVAKWLTELTEVRAVRRRSSISVRPLSSSLRARGYFEVPRPSRPRQPQP